VSIRVTEVTKRFGGFLALDNVSLDVPAGKLVALLGPSGSGKTTLLRVISGLESADSGTVLHEEQDVTRAPVRERNVGFVFQHYALFRHMTVFENVAFGLRVRNRPHDEIEPRVRELLRLIRLEGLENRYPGQLSGGQRQRVALARALAARPQVLLLDEPFGALDARVRQELRQWLRRLHDEIGVTSILVTHDQEEAFEVADTVVVMNRGRVEQIGSPEEVFEHPANAFVMDFLGNVNVFHGRAFGHPHVEVDVPAEAQVYVRPHELDLTYEADGVSSLEARVVHINPAGAVARVQLAAHDGAAIQVELSQGRYAELNLKPGDRVYVSPRRVRVFVPEYAI
jgi:sulfate transport system ATP-binding protein